MAFSHFLLRIRSSSQHPRLSRSVLFLAFRLKDFQNSFADLFAKLVAALSREMNLVATLPFLHVGQRMRIQVVDCYFSSLHDLLGDDIEILDVVEPRPLSAHDWRGRGPDELGPCFLYDLD